jgi:hypothetical protein
VASWRSENQTYTHGHLRMPTRVPAANRRIAITGTKVPMMEDLNHLFGCKASVRTAGDEPPQFPNSYKGAERECGRFGPPPIPRKSILRGVFLRAGAQFRSSRETGGRPFWELFLPFSSTIH